MSYIALVLARTDKQPGPSLVRLDDSYCDRKTAVEAFRKKLPASGGRAGVARIRGACLELHNLADQLSSLLHLDTLIVDRTGLGGKWMFDSECTRLPRGGTQGLGSPAPPSAAAAAPGPASLEIALEEQLGLKLENRRGPIDVLVIDAVQQPTQN